MNYKIKTPIIFFIFNRPELTQKVFNAIREAQPDKLFIIADGPRDTHIQDKELCQKTRAIVEKIDWNCEVKNNYSDTNMGCGTRVSSGIEWAFNYTDQIIVLEDDCLPNQDFFIFMEEMLEKYKNEDKVGSITGFSPQTKNLVNHQYSYYFSKFYHMWGWATWKRAWKEYEYTLDSWGDKKNKVDWLFKKIKDKKISKQLARDFDNVYQNNGKKNQVHAWGFQFMYTHLKNDLFCIKPRENTIENLGIGIESSTHTKLDNPLKNIMHNNLILPFNHPSNFTWNKEVDMKVFRTYFTYSEIFYYIKKIIKKIPFMLKILLLFYYTYLNLKKYNKK